MSRREDERRRLGELLKVSARPHLRRTGHPARAVADLIFLAIDQWRVGHKRGLDMIVARSRRPAGADFQDMVSRVVRIGYDLTVLMIAQHAPVSISSAGFEI